MEGELFNAIQKQENIASADAPHEVKPSPEFSFIPPELLKKETAKTQGFCVREKCAVVGAVFGGIALVSVQVTLQSGGTKTSTEPQRQSGCPLCGHDAERSTYRQPFYSTKNLAGR